MRLLSLNHQHTAAATEQRECHIHGVYTATLWALDPPVVPKKGEDLPQYLAPFWSRCPTCEAEQQSEVDSLHADIRNGTTVLSELARKRVESAGIPPRFAHATLWNWDHADESQRVCWNWAHNFATNFPDAIATGRSGAFIGSPGTGKTHLACGILRHVVEKGGSGLYMTVMSMLGRIKDTYNRHAHETESQVLAHLTSIDLLVVDEIGRQLDTNYEQAQLFRVLDDRYQANKPVLLVSNLAPAPLRKFLGESVIDRIMENGGKVSTFNWSSHRARKAKD